MSMKLYPSIEKALISSLSYIFHNQTSSTQVVRYVFKNHRKWGAKDRRLFSELFFDIVRHFGAFSEFLGRDLLHEEKLEEGVFESILQLYLDEERKKTLKEAKSYKALYHKELMSEVEENFKNQELISNYLEKTLDIAPVFLRLNRSLVEPAAFLKELEQDSIEVTHVFDNCFKLLERKNLLQLSAYKKGWFEIQDGASQEVAPFLELESATRIADTCAGAGGKSLHISDLLKGRGRVLALDIAQRRLEELKKRAKRSRFSNIETRVIKNTKTLKRLHESFDRLLIDAPCSGTGTFRRKPEGKIHFRKSKLEEYLKIQKEILPLHSKLLKPGGVMVYATCSVLKSENEDQITQFLEEHPDFSLVDERSNAVGDRGFDGFYMAKLMKRA